MAIPETAHNPELGLCLAGGGALGFLHIGLFEAMKELDLRPGIVAGTSTGAVMGAFYAAGLPPEAMRGILRGFRWAKVMAFTLHRRGILSTGAMQAYLREHLGKMDVSDLPIRLKVSALNVHTGELKVFTEGPLVKCLAASCAVPGLFEPVEIDDATYFDAGTLYNLPLELMSGEGTKKIIAGNTIGRYGLQKDPRTAEEVVYQAYLALNMNLAVRRTGPGGWKSREGEELVLIDYRTYGANPTCLEECVGLVNATRALARDELERAFKPGE